MISRLHCLDVPAAVAWTLRCRNFDGAFGPAPGCESHTGHVFCCVGALCIAGALDQLGDDKLARWCGPPSLELPAAWHVALPRAQPGEVKDATTSRSNSA